MGCCINAASHYFAMSAFKDGRCPIELDKTRHLLFSLNAMDEIIDKLGGLDKLGEGTSDIKTLRWMLTLLINEGAELEEEELTEKQVGRLIHAGNLSYVKDCLFASIALGTEGSPEIKKPSGEDTDPDETSDENTDDEGNMQAGKAN